MTETDEVLIEIDEATQVIEDVVTINKLRKSKGFTLLIKYVIDDKVSKLQDKMLVTSDNEKYQDICNSIKALSELKQLVMVDFKLDILKENLVELKELKVR